MNAISASTITKSGLLRQQPLPELLGLLLRARLTAVARLVLPGSGPAEIYTMDGQVVAVELPGNIDRLGELLAASGAIDGETVRRTIAAPRPPGVRYGRWLVDSGLLQAPHLTAALRLQIRRRLHRLFFADEGEFAIEPGEHGRGEGPERALVDPRRPVLQGVRSAWSEARFGCRLPTGSLRLEATAAEMAAYGLSPAEQALVDPVQLMPRSVAELEELAASGPATAAAAVRPIAYALWATGGLVPADQPVATIAPPAVPPERSRAVAAITDHGARVATQPWAPAAVGATARPVPAAAPPSPAAAPPSPPAAPPAVATAAAEELARLIAAKRAAIDSEDHFQVLGVSRDANRSEVKAAYLEAASKFHPDRLASAGIAHLRADAEYIFRRASEAQATLSDDARRAAYLQRLAAPPDAKDAQAEAQRILSAEVALFEGDVALKRRDFQTAMDRLQDAVRMDPSQGEAIALLAWARVCAGQSTLVEVRPEFELAVSRAPRCARAHYFLGMARKQARENNAAISSFRSAVEIDPRLAEAASELRVLQLRATRELPTVSRGVGGLFDRGKKK